MIEGPSNPIVHKPIHPGLQFLILIGILIGTIFFGSSVADLIVLTKFGKETERAVAHYNMGFPHATTALWIFQFVGMTLPILVTPILFSYLIVKQEPTSYLKTHFHFSWLLMAGALLTMLLAIPLIEYLGIFNQHLDLPKWMVEDEETLSRANDAMMQMNNFADMIFDLLFIGLLTALVEEVLFRGCMQTIFINWMKNPHVAIWTTAILFSAFHMEFSGFIPRLLLGLIFGYFTYWSGSVWPAIMAHFVNNGTIVVWNYLYQQKLVSQDPNVPQMFNNTGYLISFALTVVFLFIYWYISTKWHEAHYGEELD